jgi:hypothetical protein
MCRSAVDSGRYNIRLHAAQASSPFSAEGADANPICPIADFSSAVSAENPICWKSGAAATALRIGAWLPRSSTLQNASAHPVKLRYTPMRVPDAAVQKSAQQAYRCWADLFFNRWMCFALQARMHFRLTGKRSRQSAGSRPRPYRSSAPRSSSHAPRQARRRLSARAACHGQCYGCRF